MRQASAIGLVIVALASVAGAATGGYEIIKGFNNVALPYAGVIQGSDGALYGTSSQGGDYGLGTVFRVSADGSSFSVLHSFDGARGSRPQGPLVQGSDGAFYGTTSDGGSRGAGTVFRLSADGSSFSLLHSFDSTSGGYPVAGLVALSNGALFGTTLLGGPQGSGSVFRISSDGSSFATIHQFDGAHGSNPRGLVQGTDGALYGAASGGGPTQYGVVFKLSTDGSSFSVIHAFNGSQGAYPYAALIQGTDGFLYGTTRSNADDLFFFGTVFKLSTDGASFNVLHTFEGNPYDGAPNGATPYSALVQGSDGAFYGTTQGGGRDGFGTVFKIAADGFSVVHHFDGVGAGRPYAGVVQGTDGALYGTTLDGASLDSVFRVTTDGASFSILRQLGTAEGAYPDAGLIQGQDGAFFGTTYGGGANGGFGTVFRLSADGSSYTVLHSFDGTHGARPFADLLQGADGALYGTTSEGGSSPNGLGVVFKINPDGSAFQVLHDFSGPEGAFPYSSLVQSTDGALYGTAAGGGAAFYGTVFKINPDGSAFAVLHDFDLVHGAYPDAGVIQASDGNLYGTTGGDSRGRGSSVFRLATDGSSFAVLHKFVKAQGLLPYASLREGVDGALYGTTWRGGAFDQGTVFRISTDGSSFGVLHSFNKQDGANPGAAVMEGSDGVLYGTTVRGGAHVYYGTAFRLTPDGSFFEVLRSFDYTDGGYVYAGLLQGSDAALYGATDSGGPLSAGTVFRLTPGPTAFPQVVAATLGSSTPITLSAGSLSNGLLTYAVLSGPQHGSLTGTPPDLLYTPASSYSGPDSFTFAANDSDGNESNGAQVSITVVKGLQFAKPVFTGSEPGASVLVSVTAQVTDAATVDLVTSDGTARAGVDYVATTTQLSFAAGTSTKTVLIPLLRSTVYDGNESFLVALKNPTGAKLGIQRTAVVTISDRNPAPTIQFAVPSYPAIQGGPAVQIVVMRRGVTTVPVTVDFRTTDGTATVADGDYAATSGTLTFDAGVTTASFPVVIGNGSVAKPSTIVNLELSNPSAGSILGARAKATIVIKSTRQALQFSAAGYTVSQAVPRATILVRRTGGTAGTVSVHYFDAGTGTATPGADYSLTSGTLTFLPGVIQQTFTVDIVNDTENEGSETVDIRLSDPAGVTLLGPNPATLTILDTQPTVRFSASAYATPEPVGGGLRRAIITVRRTGSLTQPAQVSYSTTPGSAVAGVDYNDTSGTLSFGAGVAIQTFSVEILGNTLAKASPTVNLKLTSVDIPLGTPSQAVLTIRDNDVAGSVQFSAMAYSATAPASVAITVTRSGGTAGPATIRCTTADGSATAGTDYTPVSDTLTFGAGETTKTFQVDVAATGGPNKYLRLGLDTPTGGLKVGTQKNAVLWILE